LGSCLIACKAADLPFISHIPLDQKLIDKYHLEVYSEPIMLFGNVIDLNDDETLRKELEQTETHMDISKHVLLCLEFQIRLRWRKGQYFVQLRQYDEFMQQGYINTVDDVSPFRVRTNEAKI